MARYIVFTGGSGPSSFSVTAFSHSPSLVQVGASVANPAFTASYSDPPDTAVLTDTEGHSDDVISDPTTFISPHTFTKTVYGQSVTFTLTATHVTSANRDTGIVWGQNVYYGVAEDPGSYNQTFIKSLAAELKLAPQGSYDVDAASTQSTFFAARTAFGLTDLNFMVGVFGFAITKVATVSVTNSDGVSENYDLFRSDNVGLGPFTFDVIA